MVASESLLNAQSPSRAHSSIHQIIKEIGMERRCKRRHLRRAHPRMLSPARCRRTEAVVLWDVSCFFILCKNQSWDSFTHSIRQFTDALIPSLSIINSFISHLRFTAAIDTQLISSKTKRFTRKCYACINIYVVYFFSNGVLRQQQQRKPQK